MVTLAMAAVRLLFARLGLRAFFGLRLVLNPACGVCYAAAPKFPSVAEVPGAVWRVVLPLARALVLKAQKRHNGCLTLPATNGFAMRVLIIEDNADIVANLYAYLEPRGFVLDWAANAYAGLALASEHEFDAVVLDVTLPGMDGLAMCRKLRDELQRTMPVLMLTARDTLDDKVAGFDSGADDYLVKPFSLLEVEVRLKALVRRARGGVAPAAPLRVGSLVYDASTMTAVRSGKALALTKTGYRLLHCLMRESPKIVSRDKLAAEVWGDDRPDSDALRTHIHALRQALDKGYDVAMLRTVQGVGYRLVAGDD